MFVNIFIHGLVFHRHLRRSIYTPCNSKLLKGRGPKGWPSLPSIFKCYLVSGRVIGKSISHIRHALIWSIDLSNVVFISGTIPPMENRKLIDS